jgi:hypothetical protein
MTMEQVTYWINHPLVFFVLAVMLAVYLSWKAFEWDVKNAKPPPTAFATPPQTKASSPSSNDVLNKDKSD